MPFLTTDAESACTNEVDSFERKLPCDTGGGVMRSDENDRIKINYPGTGNNSQFTHDAYGRVVQIVETTASTVTSTKQFVCIRGAIKEARGGTGSLLSQYFTFGQTLSGSNYFWTKDHLGSVREMTDNSGNIQAEYDFDPFGRISKPQGALNADYQYSIYYLHSRSGLELATFRAYSSLLSRWINRDPASGGVNLYAYVGNRPVRFIDQFGLDPAASLEQALSGVCRNRACVSAENESKCLQDAKSIATSVNGFLTFYNNPNNAGTGPGPDPVNGYYCWDWAVGIAGALPPGQTSFTAGYRSFIGPANDVFQPYHYGTSLTPQGGSQCPACSVNLDDGFDHGFGSGNVHPGAWGGPPGWTETNVGDPSNRFLIQPMPWGVSQ